MSNDVVRTSSKAGVKDLRQSSSAVEHELVDIDYFFRVKRALELRFNQKLTIGQASSLILAATVGGKVV